MEVNDEPVLILSIQKFEVWGDELTVWYTCQKLKEDGYVSKRKSYKQPFMLEAESKIKYDDKKKIDRLQLGTIHYIGDQTYQLVEYTEIKLDSSDLFLSFTVKPIYPIDRSEARGKYMNERRKKLSLEVIG
jgi:tyrosine-protein phosphatase YwqE